MSAPELLRFLEGRGVYLSIDGERLRLNAPSGVLTGELEGLVAAHRRELVELLRERSSPTSFAVAQIPPAPRHLPLPASAGQVGLWYLDQVSPGDTSYNIIHAIREYGPFRLEALEQAFNSIVARQEALRTTFEMIDGVPCQVIAPELVLSVPVRDLRALRADEREAAARTLTDEEARRPFDLARGPLLRFQILRLADEEWQSVFAVHHIVCDGWSLALFNREMAALSAAFAAGLPSPLADLPIQYADYAVWQREQLAGGFLEGQLNYWRRQLEGPLPLLHLACTRPRPATRTSQGSVEYRILPDWLNHSLEALGRRNRATPFITYLAVFSALLQRYSQQDDILVGAPTAGRNRIETEGLVGLFVNTLVLRIDASANPTFKTLLARIRETALDAFSNPDVPFEELVRALHPERSSSHTPLFQVMFNLMNLDSEAKPWSLANGTAKYDLTLTLVPTSSGMQCVWEYSSDLFDSASVRRLAEHFETLLAGIIGDPDRGILELPLATEAERRQLLTDWNATGAEYPEARLHEMIAAGAAGRPDAVAAVFESESLTYAELERKANQLARHLQTLGVGPEVLVGLCVERSLDMLVGLLGILKAGGAYVPLDPAYPADRIAFMLADSQAPVLVTQQGLLAGLPKGAFQTVCLDSDWPAIDRLAAAAPASAGDADSLAYVIYTSGSTGQPKGVQITHRALVNFLTSMQREPGFSEHDTLLAVTTFSFDIAGLELYLPLLAGGRLVVASRAVAGDGAALRRALIRHGVTVMQATPVSWRLLLEAGGPPDGLKVLCGGEPLPPDLAAALLSHPVELWNLYGPTETTIWSTLERVLPGEPLSVGRPIANTQCFILDPYGKPVPAGVAGELLIGGHGVARGYLHRAELTAERFVANPFSDIAGARLYKTGDLARYRAEGRIEILGRTDNQVKLRGYRIELGEIEAIVAQQPAVQEVTVIAREDVAGDKRLVGYVTTAGKQPPTAADLRAAVRERLPEYMVPSTFVFLDAMPRTPNGKINRKALPEARGTDLEKTSCVAPRTSTEAELVAVWRDILGVRSVGVRDGFFDLGGYSLLAARLFAVIEKKFGKRLPLTTILEGDTIEHLARRIDDVVARSAWSALVPLRTEGSRPPFFCVHPVDGDVFWYFALASHIGPEQPFYGVRARGLDGLQEPHPSLEAAAADYIREIRQVQPRGPYNLGGFSWGATVAFEMARQLIASGDEVGLLASIDSPPAMTGYYGIRWGLSFCIRWVRDVPRRLARFLRNGREFRFVVLQRKWDMLCKSLGIARDDLSPHQRASRFASNIARNLFGGRSQVPAHHERVIAALYRASVAYVPQPYPGRVTVFRAEHQPAACSHDPLMDWARLSAEGVDVHTVPGEHVTILQEPTVRELALRLGAALAQSAGPAGRGRERVPENAIETNIVQGTLGRAGQVPL